MNADRANLLDIPFALPVHLELRSAIVIERNSQKPPTDGAVIRILVLDDPVRVAAVSTAKRNAALVQRQVKFIAFAVIHKIEIKAGLPKQEIAVATADELVR